MNKIDISILIVICLLVTLPMETYSQAKQSKREKSTVSGSQAKQSKKEKSTVSGIVTDDAGQPIVNAAILGGEGAIGAKSDAEGKFTIQVSYNSNLRIEAEGFEAKLINSAIAGGSGSVMLTRMLFLMDEASTIATPFGQMKKREITGAVVALNPEKIVKYDNVQLFQDALIGRIAGLLGSSNIRGMGDAVFIVDGVPRDPSNINVEEIAQITVLKDANSGILYGVHAPNGIILVTTKRGDAYKRKLNFIVEKGVSSPVALPKYVGSSDYMSLYNEARANDGLSLVYDSATIANTAMGLNPYRYPNVDYFSNEFLSKSRPFTKFLTEASGGNNTIQYYSNLGWMNTRSLYQLGDKSWGTNRFNVRGNVNFIINDFIKTYIDAVAVFNFDNQPMGDFWSNTASLHPDYYSPLLPLSLIKSDVTLLNDASLEAARKINGNYILGGSSIYTNNIYGNQAMGSYHTSINRTIQLSQGIDIDLNGLVEGLRFKTFIGLDVFNRYSQDLTNQYAVYQPVWQSFAGTDSITSLTKTGTDVRDGVQNIGSIYFARRYAANARFDYERVFKDVHSVSGMLVGYFDQFDMEDQLIPERHANLGLRLAYNYNKTYYVNFSGALVNGYKLAPGKKAGFSPSMGLGWILSQEDFLSGSSSVNYLKLKASAGIVNYESVGNDYKRYLQTFGAYTGTFSWNDGLRKLTTYTLNRAENDNLGFEKMKNINLGMEGYFFNYSLYVDANVFSSRNSGKVVLRSTLPSYLYNNVSYQNFEETAYNGADIAINWKQSLGGGFSFELGGNALYATSEVIKKDELYLNDYQYRVGKPEDAMFGLESLGYFTEEQINDPNTPFQAFGEVKPGDIRYKDQNKDGKINDDDRIEIGNSQDRFSYGLSLQLKYKNLNLFLFGMGREGAYSYYSGKYFWVRGDNKYSEEVLGRWTEATASAATYPRLSSQDNTNNFRNSTQWLYKDNYFSLERVQLTYEMPSNVAKTLFTKEMSLYVRGENLVRFSKDAEKRQLNIGSEPEYRNYSVGLRFMF